MFKLLLPLFFSAAVFAQNAAVTVWGSGTSYGASTITVCTTTNIPIGPQVASAYTSGTPSQGYVYVGSTVTYSTPDLHYAFGLDCDDPSSYLPFLTLGTSTQNSVVPASITGFVDSLLVPTANTTVLGYGGGIEYWWQHVIPNDEALSGTQLWFQWSHWWTENSGATQRIFLFAAGTYTLTTIG